LKTGRGQLLYEQRGISDAEARDNSLHMKKIALLLVDDHAVVRQGLRALLEAEGDMVVIGEAENGREAVIVAKKTLPDVVVMDVAMPGMNGLEATRQIVRNVPSAKVLVLTSYGEDDYVTQLMGAGATGYLLKQSAATDLLRAIREVRAGHEFFSPVIAKRLRQQNREAATAGQAGAKTGRLTSREAEVLQLVAEGLANKQIASELAISIKTVEKHRQQAMNKLNIHDIAGLTRYAMSKGWVEGGAPAPI
jgi:DNA-binding NarL/FixJ family response regulator